MAQGKQIALVAALVVLGIVLGGGAVFLLLSRSAPEPAASPTPAPLAPTPAPVESVEPEAESSPAAEPEKSPETSGSPAEPTARPNRPTKARTGKAAAPVTPAKEPAPAVATRSFSSGMPTANGPLVKGNVPGFEGAKTEVYRAPKVPGVLEFETDPAAPIPGKPYTVRLFLRNQGKKTIKLLSVVITASQDDVQSGGVVPMAVKEVKEGQRVLVAERQETWPAQPPGKFALQALVKSKDDDSYSRTLTLK